MNDEMIRAAAKWMVNGEVGASSKAMCTWLVFGVASTDPWDYPHDPADFDRCLRFIEAVPGARALVPQMRQLSKPWAALVDRWDEIEQCHLEEVGLGWTKACSAPKTYDLMKSVLKPVENWR